MASQPRGERPSHVLDEPVHERMLIRHCVAHPVFEVHLEGPHQAFDGLDGVLGEAIGGMIVRRRVLLLDRLLLLLVLGNLDPHSSQGIFQQLKDGRLIVALEPDNAVPQPLDVAS